MSFLAPAREPVSTRRKVLLAATVLMALIVAADALKLFNLHGFALPILMSMMIVAMLEQSWARGLETEGTDG